MTPDDIPFIIKVQPLAFPPPFPVDELWSASALEQLLKLFPEGQAVAELDGERAGSSTSLLMGDDSWQLGEDWLNMVGKNFSNFDRNGNTLFGMDIAVHPDFRRHGVGAALYRKRFELAETTGVLRYGTVCRIPDFSDWAKENGDDVERYVSLVVHGDIVDRTLTPLLKMKLKVNRIKPNYYNDVESLGYGVELERRFRE
ncbi:MAG: GNAT family N-acetyltransferase [Fimbriimonadaceae bacterium]